MKLTLLSLLFICFALPISGYAQVTNELEERAAIQAQVQRSWATSDFKTLEEISTSFRDRKEKTRGGIWKLTVFYGSFLGLDGGDYEDDFFPSTIARIDAWNKTYPKSIAAPIVRSIAYIKHGYTYRGDKMANEVSAKNMKIFLDNIKLADDNLEQNKEISSVDPAWYQIKFMVATTSNMPRAKFDTLLTEATQKHPDYLETYFQALQYVLPKWGGNVDEVEKYATNAENLTSPDTRSSIYARIYWYAWTQQFGNDIFKDSKASWPKMKSGFDDIFSKYPDSWTWNNYLKFACLAEDKKTATALFAKKQEWDFMPQAWEPEFLFETCRQWAEQ